MTDIVSNGQTVTVTLANGFSITSNSTIDAGGLFDGAGAVTGAFTLLNDGTMSGDVSNQILSINTGTLTNSGTVIANNGSLTVQSGVVLTNLSSGTLTGGVWESNGTGALAVLPGSIITDNATITLNGTASTIEGASGTAIDNTLTTVGTAGVLNLLGGRSFAVSNSLVVGGTVTLAGGTLSAPTNGVTINATGDVLGFGTLDPGSAVVDTGKIEASGGTLVAPGLGEVSGAGTLQADAAASLALQALGGAYAESIVNNGTIDAAFAGITGTLDISGAYSGTGSFLIEGGTGGNGRTILELPANLSANVAFDTNVGELLLDSVPTFHGTIAGFGNTDTIVMPNLGNAVNATLSGSTLNITNGSGGTVEAIAINTSSMNYSEAIWNVTENLGNSQATLKVSGVTAAACYAAGTRIKTPTGEIAVEHLVAGDMVHAHFAGTAAVVWIGHRHVDCRRHPKPAEVWPVRVSAHAFGPRMPSRDVLLSPDHAVFAGDVLIPIKHLINGKTITQEKVDTVTYYHLELAEHDVLLADGLPAESYLETGNRAAFDNAGGEVALYPDFGMRRWEAFGCAPLVVTGPLLNAVNASVRGRVPKAPRTNRTFRRVA